MGKCKLLWILPLALRKLSACAGVSLHFNSAWFRSWAARKRAGDILSQGRPAIPWPVKSVCQAAVPPCMSILTPFLLYPFSHKCTGLLRALLFTCSFLIQTLNWALEATWMDGQVHPNKNTYTLHYMTFHYITLHYMTFHYITLHYIALQCIALQRHVTLRHQTISHHITSHDITSPHHITSHHIASHYITSHYITLQYSTLHYTTLHYITLYYNIILNYLTYIRIYVYIIHVQ